MALSNPVRALQSLPPHGGLRSLSRLPWRWLLLLAGVLAGGLAGWTVDEVRQPRGVTYGLPPLTQHAERTLGVNVDLVHMLPAAQDQFFAQSAVLGIRWIRLALAWRDLEQNASSGDWTAVDRVFSAATAHGVKILVVIGDEPAHGAAPDDIIRFGRAVHALADNGRGRVSAYQVWDEPNIAAGWGGQYPDATAYARLLREAYIEVHAADPNAIVVSAALAPTTESGPLNVDEADFLRDMYRVGARDAFDVLGAEPFGFWSGPDDRRIDPGVLNFSRLVLLREVMQSSGDGGKAIWATAFGWYTQGASDSPFGGDTADKQAARSLDAIRRARDEWPWLGPVFFARWQPQGVNDPRAGFALVQLDGSTSPLFAALESQSADSAVATVGLHAPDDPSAQFGATWRVTPLAADPPQSDVSPVVIRFRGTRFDLVVRRGFYEGVLFARIDGAPANALPHDEQGRSYAVLYDPLGQDATVTVARGIADGEHVAELVPQGGWGQWAVLGWLVSRERPTNLAWPLAGAALGGLLAVAGAFLAARTADRRMRIEQIAGAAAGRYDPLASRLMRSTDRFSTPAIFVAGILLYYSPALVLSWLLIALLALLILRRIETGLALVALAIPFYLQPKPLGAGSYSVVEIVLLLCVAAYGLRWATGKVGGKSGIREDAGTNGRAEAEPGNSRKASARLLVYPFTRFCPLDWVVLLWVAAGALGVVVAENFGVANRELRVVFVEPAIYYALVRATRAGVWPLVNAFLLGAVAISGKALLDWARHTDLITAEGVLQARSVYASPNNLALYLDRAAPLALALGLFGRRWRWLYLPAFAVMLVALYLTFVKGAWLLAVPAAFILIGIARGRRFFAGMLGLLILLGAGLVPVMGTTRIRSLFDLTSGTSFVRVQLWQSSLAMIRDHFVFGVGPDNFLYQYRTYYILPSAFAEASLSHPHDILLDFWTRLGLVGVVLLALLLLTFWREAWRLYRRQSDGDARALTLGMMAAMLAALAHGLIDNSFFLVDLAFVLMLMLASVQVHRQT